MKNLFHIYYITLTEEYTFKKNSFNTLLWMNGQMMSQYTYVLMKLLPDEEATQINSTVPLDQLEQAN